MSQQAMPSSPFPQADAVARFNRSERIYLETSALNALAEEVGIKALEIFRAEQRSRNRIFVTSPMLLWEIMQISDEKQADFMMMAAQALFDPVLLGTPTELVIRYLESAYPRNIVNYGIATALPWGAIWARMTRNFGCRLEYDREALLDKTRPYRDISRNLTSIIDGVPHKNAMVEPARQYVGLIYDALEEDLKRQGPDGVTAKLVILYTYLLLLTCLDLDGSAARNFWASKDFPASLQHGQVSQVFIDYPEIFVRGPLLEMANMASMQYCSGKTNRGALHDGMHMVYAPHVDVILSADSAFLTMARSSSHYSAKIMHPSDALGIG